MVSMESVWSWSDLERKTTNLAREYLRLGLKPGDRVASLMPNRIALIAHYIGCFKAGLVATPLNYRYTKPEIDHALEVSDASIILAHTERAADIVASKASTLPLGVITYGAPDGAGPNLEKRWPAPPRKSCCRSRQATRRLRSSSPPAAPDPPRA